MPRPNLKTCPFLGPPSGEEQQPSRPLPADYESQPFRYLPPRITLSQTELELAGRYEKGDFAGGYLTSQIACFRRGSTAEQHQKRREKFRRLKAEVDQLGLLLPDAYIELVESDDYVAKLRHNCIWLRLPDELAGLPSYQQYKLFLIFAEGQGCGYWHLLLGPDRGHVVTYSEHPFGLRGMFLPGYEPDLASIEVYKCADSFSQWIVNFFAESVEGDRQYEKILEKYPGT
jgi:hypothetical protein